MNKTSRGSVLSAKKAVIAELSAADRVLDIGCGTGEFAAMLAARGTHVDGFDINPDMVEVARERILANHLENVVSIHHMGVDGMDAFPDSTYDAIVSMLVFSELSDDERHFALKHSVRALKPDGLFVIADEVVPRKKTNRVLYTIIRIPMLLATYLVARTTTRPIADLTAELLDAGFRIEREIRNQGDAFVLVVARVERKDSQ
jgi:demethylmenaquinone methyltransferase/2-methoxy-6-polyprenyl-1,4-benzoquinol methylase